MSERSGQSSGTRAGRLALYTVPVLAAAIAGFIYFAPTPETQAQSGSVQVSGSETMRPVVTACAEDFMTRNPDADVIVKGGGSGDGIAALLHGVADISMTSRELSGRERDYAASNGIKISMFELAMDGVSVIVNRSNDVTSLNLDQLRDAFAGRINDWRDLGGEQGGVLIFARTAGSGTGSLFGERIMGETAYGPSAQLLPTNDAIVGEIAALPGAIGYADLGALQRAGDRVKVVALSAGKQSTPVQPTPETIRSGQYALARSLYLSTAGEPTGVVRAFVDFCIGPAGREILERAGYIGVGPAPPSASVAASTQ